MPYSDTELAVTKEEQIARLMLVARAYDAAHKAEPRRSYHSIPYMENTPPETLALVTTDDTSLAIAVLALQTAGIDVEPKVGSLQKVLGLTDKEMHELACACHGHRMGADYMSAHITGLANTRQMDA